MAGAMDLGLDDDELSTCVACGLCLPHCPTFRATGEEALSPRGRIDAMRAVQWRGAEADDEFVHFMETCVQCRGCEPACPSGVPFGRLMEHTREALAEERLITPRWQRLAFSVLGRHRLLLAGSTLLALAQRVRLVPARLGLPRLALRRGRRPADTGTDVWLFTGCVMDAWQRETHRATADVMTAVGVTYSVPRRGGDCCGALHVHAGLDDAARRLARRVMASMPGDAPIVVNSAGCGAALKAYDHLLGTAEAAAFSARVVDVHEWLVPRLDRLVVDRRRGSVIVQDPCHLRHVQRAHLPVRAGARPRGRRGRARRRRPVLWRRWGLLGARAGARRLDPRAQARRHPPRHASVPVRRSWPAPIPGARCTSAAAGVTVRHPIDIVAEAIR